MGITIPWSVLPIVCDSSKDGGNCFRRKASLFAVIPHWLLNLLMWCKGSMCPLLIMKVGTRYFREKSDINFFWVQVQWSQMWERLELKEYIDHVIYVTPIKRLE